MNKKYFFLITITALVVILIYQLGQSVSNSLDSITTDLKNEENISLLQSDPSENINVSKGSTHSELIIAQQIERFLAFNHSNISILENIYGNMDYYKNPTAVLFYLSYAYQQLGQYQKALTFLDEIIQKNDTQYTFLYLFGSKRLDEIIYYTAVQAELSLRKAQIYYLLNQPEQALEYLRNLSNIGDISYGYGNMIFRYSDLAVQNINNIEQAFISSEQRFFLVASAKHLVKSILSTESKKMIANYLSTEYGSLIFERNYTSSEVFLENYDLMQAQFDELPTANFTVDFVDYETKGDADFYYFRVGDFSFEIINKLNQQYLLKLQKE